MKKIVWLGIIFLIPCFLKAQATVEGVRFMDNAPWSEVIKAAEQQQKLIFVDCYTSWCGPCQMLARQVFPREDVGALFNAHFVSVKYDVERGEGLAFAEARRDLIQAYPTMLVYNLDGRLLLRMVGSRSAETLIQGMTAFLEGKTWQDYEKEYNAGNRDYDFVTEFLNILLIANQLEKYYAIRKDYITGLPLDSLLSQRIWNMAKEELKDPLSVQYQFVLRHLSQFQQKGFNLYDVENVLSVRLMSDVHALIQLGFETENADALAQLQERLNKLERIARYPVKGFPECLAAIRVEESFLFRNYEEMYYRLIYLGENGLLANPFWVYPWVDELAGQLKSKKQIRRCMDYFLGMQKTAWSAYENVVNAHEVLAKLYDRLGDKAKAVEETRLSEAWQARYDERKKTLE